MRRTSFLLLMASVGITLACSDRSPTSPEMTTIRNATESAGVSPLKTDGRGRHVIVVPPRGDGFVRPGTWGSEKASLAVAATGATLEILASGGCYGSYGETAQPIPNGPFSISGTFTQLTGVYPGKIEYAAQLSGVVEGNSMSIAITVPALPATYGPFALAEGVANAWSRCLYP